MRSFLGRAVEIVPISLLILTEHGCSRTPVTFLDLPAADPGAVRGGVAILGVPHGVRYPEGAATGSAGAPSAIRSGSQRLASFIGHHDFDAGAPMLPNADRVVDCGDVAGDPSDGDGSAARAESSRACSSGT